jgi:hypothetical protein
MQKIAHLLLLAIIGSTTLSSCVGDDFLDDFREPEIRITTLLDTLEINTSFQMEGLYLNNVGAEETVQPTWQSSNEVIATIDENGLLTAHEKGETIISVHYESDDLIASDSTTIIVGGSTAVEELASTSGEVQTTSSYKLRGDFTYSEKEDGNGVILELAANYCTSDRLPGLYIYLSNNRNSVANAFEIGEVDVFEGAHTYDIEGVAFTDFSYIVYFCKPFNVKVGDGEL